MSTQSSSEGAASAALERLAGGLARFAALGGHVGDALADLEILRSALSEVERGQGWRTMESFDKNAADVQTVLAAGWGDVGEARYYADEDTWWWACDVHDGLACAMPGPPTHWMPLPAPPESAPMSQEVENG